MFSKIVLVCFLAALVLAEQDLQDKDYTERVQQQKQLLWQQYKPDISFTRNSEGVIQKIVRLPFNPFFQGIRVNVKPYPGGYVAIKADGAEIIKPFTSTPDTTEKDEEIIIQSQTPEEQLQEQIRQQQQLQQQIIQQQRGYQQRYITPQQQGYLTRYPTWSRFLQPQQQQQQVYYQQQNPFGDDIYNQDQQGEYDRAVRDTKKDKKNKSEKQQEKDEEGEGLYRVPLYYQQYQRVPYQIYDQQQFYPQQQGPYTNQFLNRLMGYQQYEQQYPYYYQQQYPYYQQQQYQVPVYGY